MKLNRLALNVVFTFCAALLVDVAAMRVALAQQINLTGDWISAYSCPGTGVQYPLPVRVVHHGQSIVAIKLAGDQCIEQKNLTVFQGDLTGFSSQMECATYGGEPPVLSYVVDSIQVQSHSNFIACQASFRRVGGSPPAPPVSTAPPPVTGPASCNASQWFSSQYKRCFDKRGQCSQYNHTDSKTCNSRSDNLRCDWDVNNNTCFAE